MCPCFLKNFFLNYKHYLKTFPLKAPKSPNQGRKIRKNENVAFT